jgi:hypothetical protein
MSVMALISIYVIHVIHVNSRHSLSIQVIHVNSWHSYHVSMTFLHKINKIWGGLGGGVKYIFLGLQGHIVGPNKVGPTLSAENVVPSYHFEKIYYNVEKQSKVQKIDKKTA